jgi:hypothetical protein
MTHSTQRSLEADVVATGAGGAGDAGDADAADAEVHLVRVNGTDGYVHGTYRIATDARLPNCQPVHELQVDTLR